MFEILRIFINIPPFLRQIQSMNESHRKKLQVNQRELARNLTVTVDFLACMEEGNILTKDDSETIQVYIGVLPCMQYQCSECSIRNVHDYVMDNNMSYRFI